MKKIVFLAFVLTIFSSVVLAQGFNSPTPPSIADRASDHFMIQLGSDHWANVPDSISANQKGFSRGLNIYLMFNKPFKTNPKMSVAFGLGIGSSNIIFNTEEVGVASTSNTIPFPLDSSSTNHFKKYKLETSFLEAPIELRYTAHPYDEKKSLKLALGVKVGFMLDAHTKAKDLEDKNGNIINDFVEKESSTRFFNTTRVCGTARIGYGNFSIFGAYQITTLFKDGAGPDIKYFQIGFCLSGL
jgi:hypothetical protein